MHAHKFNPHYFFMLEFLPIYNKGFKMKEAQRHKVKLSTLTFSGVGTIVGSGWLFGSANAAAFAGPAAIFSWILGALMVLIIALNLIEISSNAPVRMGSMGYYLRYTHGSFASFIAEWAILIGFISSVPSEATASTQYLSDWNFEWTHSLFNHTTLTITPMGLIVASFLCIVYFLINYYSLSFLAKSIKAITIFKLIVPIISIIVFLAIGFDSSNFHAVGNHTLAPYGYSEVLTAITSAGVVYAFNGFQTPITFAAEAENPKRDIPLAILGAIGICTVIYVLLQFSYIAAVPHNELINNGGWNKLNFSSPFAALAIALNMNFIAICLYADAFVSPSGAGIIYSSTAARVICGLASHMPKAFSKLDTRTGLPRVALFVVLLLSFVSLWLLPSWEELAAVISVGYVLSYATVPVCTSSFRKIAPVAHKDAIRIKGMSIIAPLGFIFATYMLYWSCWPLNGEVIAVVLIGLPLYFYYAYKNGEKIFHEIGKCMWIITYLIAIAIFGYIGSTNFGGHGFLANGWDHVILAIVAIIFFIWGRAVSYKTPYYMAEIENREVSSVG